MASDESDISKELKTDSEKRDLEEKTFYSWQDKIDWASSDQIDKTSSDGMSSEESTSVETVSESASVETVSESASVENMSESDSRVPQSYESTNLDVRETESAPDTELTLSSTESSYEESTEDYSISESTVIEIPDDEFSSLLTYQPFKAYKKRNRGIWNCLNKLSPCFTFLLLSKRNEYRGIKAMLGFPVGVLFGYALYKLVLDRLQLTPEASQTLGGFLCLALGVGFAISVEVRCVAFLTLPTLCGKSGRMYLSTYVVTLVIAGPIANLMSNGRESVRVVSCIAALNLNHTVERFKLMFKPVQEIVKEFIGAGHKMQQDTKELDTGYNVIENEVNDEDEMKQNMAETEQVDQKTKKESRVSVIKKKFANAKKKVPKLGEKADSKYGMKSELRCENIFNKGVQGCYQSFGAAYERCMKYLPIIGYLLCWPVKLSFICDIVSSYMGRRACDSSNALSPGFGESVETAEGVEKEFSKQFKVTMQYQLDIPPEEVDRIMPQDIKASIQNQYERRKKRMDFWLNMINRMMAFMFLQVFFVSRNYCNKYLKKIDFDNKYITSYFRHIDARRHKQDKRTLLPLKKGEKTELMEPLKIKCSSEEKMSFILNTVRLMGECVTVSIILLFDWLFYEFLMLIQRYANVTYNQTGMHHIKMTIYGDGFMGNLVRSIMKGFDKKRSIEQVTSTADCLPRPSKLSLAYIYSLYGLFLLILFLNAMQSYSMRLRRVICAFFYPKREKKRVLFLYNDRLRKRKSFLKHMRNRVRKMAKEQTLAVDSGLLFSLRHFYPRCFGWLGKLGLGRRKCLVCQEAESSLIPIRLCSDDCPICYCAECWNDLEGKCFVCFPGEDDSYVSEDEDSDKFEDD